MVAVVALLDGGLLHFFVGFRGLGGLGWTEDGR